jgi:hypothetical protein
MVADNHVFLHDHTLFLFAIGTDKQKALVLVRSTCPFRRSRLDLVLAIVKGSRRDKWPCAFL